MKIINMFFVFLILSIIPMIAMAEEDPTKMIGNITTWGISFFDALILLVIVVIAILYLFGVLSARMIAKAIGGVGIVLGALFIFHGLPWLATNIF